MIFVPLFYTGFLSVFQNLLFPQRKFRYQFLGVFPRQRKVCSVLRGVLDERPRVGRSGRGVRPRGRSIRFCWGCFHKLIFCSEPRLKTTLFRVPPPQIPHQVFAGGGFVVFADCLADLEKVKARKIRKGSLVSVKGKLQSFVASAVCLSDCRLTK